MTDGTDALDRALFALPLEDAPAGLRDAILDATIYARTIAAAQPPVLRTWEVATIGALLAIACWFGLFLAGDRPHAAAFETAAFALGRGFADPQTLLWLAAGGAVAAWVSFAHASSGFSPGPTRVRRS